MRRFDSTCLRVSSLPAAGSLRAAITLVLIGLFSPTLPAVSIWDGGGSTDNWTNGANWFAIFGPGTAPPNNGTADIVMPPVTGLVQTPLVDVPYSIKSLSFGNDNGNGRFVILAAEELTIGAGGITNNDADIESVIGPVKLSANQTWNAAAGRLQMDSVNLNGFDLAFAGAFQIDVLSLILGTGGLTLADGFTSTVRMSFGGNNTYAGLTSVQGGTLALATAGIAVPGDLLIGDGATVRLDANEQISQAAGNEVTVNTGGQLVMNFHTETLARLVLNGGHAVATGAGNLTAAEVVVTGSTANWTNNSITVGDSVNGTLDVEFGGDVTSNIGYIGNLAGSTGEVTITGTGSTWDAGSFRVGNSGHGTLNITAGGAISSSTSYIGDKSGSMGEVNVDGAGSTWTDTGVLYVGDDGDATLNITAGGIVTDVFAFVGKKVGSMGAITVDGTGSTWTNSQGVDIGNTGTGTLDVTNGGQVSSVIGVIGNNIGSIGTVTVGMGSIWTNTGVLYVGYEGDGTLEITAGGDVTGANGYIGYLTGSMGAVTVAGMGSSLTIGSSGSLTVGNGDNGTLTVTNDGTVSAANVIVGALGSIHGDGNIVGLVQNGGLVSPGTSPGALHVDGNYTQSADGQLLIELSTSSYDQLLVTNQLTLAGTLTVNLIDGLTPGIGQTFTILTADDVDGTFATEMLPSVPNLGFDVIYNAQSVVLIVLSALPGDYNGNGTVDAADYVVWRKYVGAATLNNRDPNSMGPVGQADFDFWRMHFGETIGSGAGADEASNAAVPEPASLALLLFAAAVAVHRRARRAIV